jgi:hypothetical protein
MKKQRIELYKKVANGKLTPEQADEQLLGLFNVSNRFSMSDKYVEDSICELDYIIPKYFKATLADEKPMTYSKEMRTWLAKVLNGC